MPYVNVLKPTGTPYTNSNSSGKEGFDDAGVTFDASGTFFDSISNLAWTNLAKPTGSVYTSVSKPT